jgi:hypothetical protein
MPVIPRSVSLAALAVLVAAFPAISGEPPSGLSVALFSAAPAEEHELGGWTPELTIAKVMERELRRRGYETSVLNRTVASLFEDGLEESVQADIFVEIAADQHDGEGWGAIGTGGRVGSVDVGGTVAIVRSVFAANVRIYDGRTGEVLDEFELSSRALTPALSSISLGGDHAWLTIGVPWFERRTRDRAATALARKVVAEVEQAGARLEH